jgi:hypothetical protein
MSYYVYRHIRLDTNTPFYVGKGRNKRSFSKLRRNKIWQGIVENSDFEAEIMVRNLSENDAFEKEKEFIKLYKSLGYCEANMTNGGKGSDGYTHTKKARKNIGDSSRERGGGRIGGNKLIGKKRPNHVIQSLIESNKNRIVTEFTREKISKSKTGKEVYLKRKKIADNLGNLFGSVFEAASHHNIHKNSISNILNGRAKQTQKGLTFKFAE